MVREEPDAPPSIHAVFDQLPLLVAILRGPDMVVEYASPTLREVFGGRQLAGRPLAESMPEILPFGVGEHIASAYETGETISLGEQPFPTADGDRWFDVVHHPLRTPDGTIQGVLSYAVEVTARVLERRERQLGEERLRAALAASHLIAAQYDRDLRLQWLFNPHPDFLGRVGMHASEILGEQAEPLIRMNEEVLRTGRPLRGELEMTLSDGRHLYDRLVEPVWGETGEVIGVTVVANDITAKRAAEEELVRARQEAEDASRAKDRFLASVSHEIRNPLTPVLMAAAHLEKRDDLPEDVSRTVSVMRRNVEHTARLIDDLLDVSRFVHGPELQLQSVDGRALVEELTELCGPEARERGLRVDHTCQDEIWLRADPQRIRQVLSNLVRNAMKFTPRGGHIELRCLGEGDRAVLEVQDDGRGIAPELLPHVFEPFRQGDRREIGQFAGLGLGLAISKELVGHMEGAIEVRSEGLGQGTLLRVLLPRATTPADRGEQSGPPGDARSLGALRLLLLEDHEDGGELLAALLRHHGHTVTLVRTLAAARRAAADARFDLVLTDLALPDGSGHDLVRELRAHGRATPVVALSGFGSPDDQAETGRAGFAAHLVKPIRLEALLECMAAVLG